MMQDKGYLMLDGKPLKAGIGSVSLPLLSTHSQFSPPCIICGGDCTPGGEMTLGGGT